MKKDFWAWHSKKEQIDAERGVALFHEREVWWCTLGTNIGFEQNGSSELFTRPVVILSKFNLDACLIVPLTAKPKNGKYYFSVGDVSGRDAVAVLSQIRFVDRRRLALKIATMNRDTFQLLTKAVVKACFPNIQT
jgi:mRNA interferase MazF